MKTNPLHIAAAVCLAAVGVSILVFIARTNNASQWDFVSFWAAGQKLVHGAYPYDGGAELRIESRVGFDRVEPIIMRNPPPAVLLACSVGFVRSNVGIVLWFIVLLFSLVASVHMLWTPSGAAGQPLAPTRLLLCAPVMGCPMLGQFSLLFLFGVVLFLFFHKSRPFLAGAVLLLCAIKPHLCLPFGVALAAWALSSKTYHILAGACAALLAGCAVAFCIDRQGWSQYSLMI
jgi:hypothetical protein